MEQPSTYRVGKDILSFCNKCNLPLSHTIVSMLDHFRIAKVKCNTCQGQHKFKDPALVVANRSKTPRPPAKKTAKSEIKMENYWENAMKEAEGTPRKYSIKELFSVGDIIDHKTFGIGVIESKFEGDKIHVVFKAETKTLIHNKK